MFSSAWREEVVIREEEAVEVGTTSGREEDAVVVDDAVEVAAGATTNALWGTPPPPPPPEDTDGALYTVTDIACEVVALPAPSTAMAVMLWDALLVCVVSQLMEYGLDVDSPRREPSR